MTHDEARLALGAFVLGALPPGERAEVERHARRCARCTAELAELEALTPGLTRAAGYVEPTPSDVDVAMRRVAAARGREQRRSRVLMGVAAALLVGGIGTVRSATRGEQPQLRHVALQPAAMARGASGSVATDPHGWGVVIEVRLRDLPKGGDYRLVAIAVDGTREQAAAWRGVGGGVRLAGATAIPADRIDRIVVEQVDLGEVLALAV
jgi:anti-sigma factor RsiW